MITFLKTRFRHNFVSKSASFDIHDFEYREAEDSFLTPRTNHEFICSVTPDNQDSVSFMHNTCHSRSFKSTTNVSSRLASSPTHIHTYLRMRTRKVHSDENSNTYDKFVVPLFLLSPDTNNSTVAAILSALILSFAIPIQYCTFRKCRADDTYRQPRC